MKTVKVLLSTFNGERYLKEQLESLLNQKGVSIKIIVRDDGSTDKTLDILEEYRVKGNLEYIVGENIGYRNSFLYLASLSIGKADYYAFCDQDDVWESEKLLNAINILEKINNPYKLYFSNLIVVNDKLEKIGFKDYSLININLGTAMVRYNISGCTMVFNDNLLRQLIKKPCMEANFGGHDAWLYKICLSIGGKVAFDKNSYIYYRQHGNNVTGIRQGMKKRLAKEIKGFTVNKNYKFNCAKVIYKEYNDLLTNENKILLEDIISYKNSIISTTKLLTKKELNSGITSVDILNKLKIIFRCY